jgi:hypothetical protein
VAAMLKEFVVESVELDREFSRRPVMRDLLVWF